MENKKINSKKYIMSFMKKILGSTKEYIYKLVLRF